MDTARRNKELVRRYLGLYDRGDMDGAMTMCVEDYVWQGNAPQGQVVIRGKAALRSELEAFKAAMPDCRAEILDMVAEGDMVAARLREYGHHTGTEWLGVQPSGAYVEWFPFVFFRLEDGLLAEEWFTDDPYTILRCLGVKDPA